MRNLLLFAFGILLLIPGKVFALSEITPPPISDETVNLPDVSNSHVALSDDGSISLRRTPTLQENEPKFTKKVPSVAKTKRATESTLNDFLGTWIQRNTSVYSGDEYTPVIKIYQENGEIFVENLYDLGTSVKATWDESDGSLSILPQTLYTHSTYGACTINTWTLVNNRVVYNATNPIKVTLSSDGSLQFSQWGLFVSSGSYAGACFDAFYSSIAQKSNGSFHTISFDSTPVDTTYSVLVYQPDESRVAVANLLGNGKPYYITLGADSSYILPQYVMNLSLYGDFYLYAANASSGAISKTSYITVTPGEDSWDIGPWGIYCMASTSIIASYGKTNTLTTDFKITYPTVGDNPMSGSGSESDPYLIKSMSDLRYIALTTTASNSYAGKYFKLENDIDASTYTDPYYVIGTTSSIAFKGSLDGNNKTISNLTVDFGGNFYAGLLGNVGAGGDIKNLNLSNISFSGSGKYLGGIVGYTTANITNCTVNGTLDATNQEIGGVVGYVTGGTVSDCSFSGTIYGGIDIGGIIGYTTGSIENCNSNASLYLSYTVPYTTINTHAMGGIVAATYGTTSSPVNINKCWFSGAVADLRGIDHIGGIAGYVSATNMTECFNTGYIISRGSTYVDGASAAAGGLSGYVSRGTYTDCFNAGTVSAPNTEFAGGLMGYGGGASTYEVVFNNCYTTGMINTKSQYDKVGVTGSYFSKAKLTINNCYYDYQTTGLDTIATGYMSTADLTSGTLPAGFDSEKWTATAGLYPQLKSMVGLNVSNLAVSPFFLSDNEIIGKIRKNFTVSTANNVTWGILQSDGTVVSSSDGVKIADGNVTLNNVYASESLVAVISNGAYKLFTIRLVPNVFSGDGTEQNPYLIQNKDDLLVLQSAVNEHSQSHKGDYFKLTNDLDLSNESSFIGIAGDGSGSTSFAGIFDGGNHTIHNWNLQSAVLSNGAVSSSSSRSFSGFFGILNTTGVVKNLNIASDCSFSFYKYSAPVVGYSMGKVYNCKNYANVTTYGTYCGGVVGVSIDDTEISGCLNAGEISASDGMTGGIVGYNTGLVTNSFNAGNIIASSSSSECANVGGVVGGSYGTISYCGNNGQITGLTSLGGIVGGSAKNSTDNTGGNVIGCINTGVVSGTTSSSNGAIIGNRASYNDISDNYYDNQMNPAGGVGGGDGVGISGVLTRELVNASVPEALADYWTFSTSKYPVNTIFANDEVVNARLSIILMLEDVDCVNSMENQATLYGENTTWSLKNGTQISIADGKLNINITSDDSTEDVLTAVNNNGYTKSYSLVALKALFSGKGTENDPHIIASIADMNTLANAVNEKGRSYSGHYFKLTNDIDYTDAVFTPISTETNIFSGNFLGNGKSISNISYGSTDSGKYVGLFSRVGSAGSVSDLTLKSTAFAGNSYVGSFAGEFAGTMTNCVNEGTVTTGGNYAGGLVGYFTESSTVVNCVNKGVVTASKGSYIGGLAGVFYGNGYKCSNVANINGYTTYIGGLTGSLRGTFDECFNSGDVTSVSGGNYVGGLTASVEAGTVINNSYNTGNIIGAKAYAGGLYGGSVTLTSAIKENGAIVTNCYNSGTINGSSTNVGGLSGLIAPGHHIRDCYNLGEVNGTGGNVVAGIVAETRGNTEYTTTIERCFNYGKVNMTASGKQSIGGIVGKLAANSAVYDCGNVGNVETKGYFVGGIVGNQLGHIYDCWNTGDVTGANYAIGGVAGYCGSSTTINRCFNSGYVKATEKSTKTYGTVAGICGYGYGIITDCVNTGNLEGYLLMGGIAGTKLGTTFDIIRCYNTGKITIADGVTTMGNIFASAVNFTGPNYYDSSVNGTYSTDTYATGLTTTELMNLNIGENFVNPEASYPVPAAMKDIVDVRFPTARYLLSDGDTETNVRNNFKVSTCDGMVWTSSDTDLAQIVDGTVQLASATGKSLTLTLTYGEKSKSFDFIINKKNSGVEDLNANPIISERYFDLHGIEVVNPSKGNIYIVKTVYQDGTATVDKKLVK